MPVLRSGIRDNEKFELIRMLRTGEFTKTQLVDHFQVQPEILDKLIVNAKQMIKSGKYSGSQIGESSEPRVNLFDEDELTPLDTTLVTVDEDEDEDED